MAENKEVPDRNIGVPLVRKYANYRTLDCTALQFSEVQKQILCIYIKELCGKFLIASLKFDDSVHDAASDLRSDTTETNW